MQRIKTGDTVEVVAGKDKGARGEILRIETKSKRVVVERVNVLKKHQRPMQAGRQNIQPGIIEFEGPIHTSNVMLVCPHCDAKVRVGYRMSTAEVKVRFCKKCNQDID